MAPVPTAKGGAHDEMPCMGSACRTSPARAWRGTAAAADRIRGRLQPAQWAPAFAGHSPLRRATAWTGHAVILGRREAVFQNKDLVLSQFGRRVEAARRAYRDFVKEGVAQGRRPELSGGGLLRSIGGPERAAELRRGRERWAADERGCWGAASSCWRSRRPRRRRGMPARSVGGGLRRSSRTSWRGWWSRWRERSGWLRASCRPSPAVAGDGLIYKCTK